MAGTENLEQELLGDIIKVRSTLKTNWGYVQSNAATISAILNHQLDQLSGIRPSSIKTDLDNVKTEIENTLSSIDLSYLKSAVQEAEQKFKSTLDPLLNDIESLESDTLLQNFEKVMDQVADLDGLPSGIKSAIKPVEHIVEAILGGDFSVALKDLPNHAQSGNGTDSGANKQTAAAATSLFKSLGTSIESLMTTLEGNPAGNIANQFQGLESGVKKIAKKQLTGLENNVFANLAALFDNLEGLGPGQKAPLSLELVMSTLENLLEDEKSQISTTITSLFKHAPAAFTTVQTMMADIKSIKLEAGSELYELFALILPDNSEPDLIDLVSLVIAIPFTLVLKTTQQNPPLITNPYTNGGHNDVLSVIEGSDNEAIVSGEASLIITGTLQMVTTYFAGVDKLVDYYFDNKGSATPYQWKIFKTLFSTACTSTTMALSAPTTQNPFTSPTLKSSVWLSQLFTSLGFGFVKGMTDAYQTRKLTLLPKGPGFSTNLQTLKTSYDAFYKSSCRTLINFYKDYIQLNENIKKYDTSYIPLNLSFSTSSAFKSMKRFDYEIGQLNTDEELDKIIEVIKNFVYQEPNSIILHHSLHKVSTDLGLIPNPSNKVTNLIGQVNTFMNRIDKLPTKLKPFFKTLHSSLPVLSSQSPYEIAKAKKDKILSRNFATAGLLFQVCNLVLNSHLAKKSTTNDKVNFALSIGIATPDIVDSITGLYWYKAASSQALTDSQKIFKKRLGYFTFFTGKLLTITSATDKFLIAGESAQIKNATYSSTANTLTVDFTYEVNVKAGKTMNECFTISGSEFSINPTTPSASASSFTLTITDDLVLPATIEVKSDCFTSPNGDSISSKQISITGA